MHRGSIKFRNANIGPNGIRGGKNKQLLSGPAIPCVDEISKIDVAPGDDTAKWGVNVLERFQLLKPPDIGLRGSYSRAPRGIISHRIVYFLLRYAVRLNQFFIPRGGNARKIFVGLHATQIGARRSEERRVGKECRSRWSPY